MIVFSAFTPHTPLLLPPVGKDNLKKLEKTKQAMEKIAIDLATSKPDTIIILTSHHAKHDAFSIDLNKKYHIDLSEFGDLATKQEFKPDLETIEHLKRAIRKAGLPLSLDTNGALDHGTAVPLALTTEGLEDVKIIPISKSIEGPKEHLEFGRILKEVVMNSNQRIAIIASGDLSHCLSSDSPEGYKKEGQIFDDSIKDIIENLKTSKLISLDQELIEEAAQCAYRPLLMLFGIIERMNIRPEILSYESPFGVGYMVAEFHM